MLGKISSAVLVIPDGAGAETLGLIKAAAKKLDSTRLHAILGML